MLGIKFLFLRSQAKMWSLQNLLFTICIALRWVTNAGGVIRVMGYLGNQVKISCPYGEGYESYEKYLCKNDCGDDDVLITTSNPRKTKYMIHDDKRARIFTTTVFNLLSTDGGKYWCGVTRNGADIYTEVELKLVQDSCCDTVTKIQSYEGYSVSISCTYESEYQNNLKYICRGNRPSTCLQQALVTSEKKQNGRFRLDDGNILRIFTVTTGSLVQSDSGSYLCGVQRNSDLDVFSAVQLEVQEWCCVTSKKTSGTAGHPLTLQCPYPPQHRNNRKFLCKGDHRNNCNDMVTSQSRFTLRDDVSSSSFSVVIRELEAADAGTYWCGSDSQWRVGNYVKIELSVDAALYAVYAVPAVLLPLICVLVVIVYKCKHYKAKGDNAVMNRNTLKEEGLEEVMGAAESDIYGNQDVVMYSKKQTSKQHARNHYDDEDDPDYENFTTEEIYCNENFHQANRR
ncbi:polymeric immunoglobulin receptor-like isoform X2 [Archocentrus centrarchus]|uniref:polymeric immunoglobulin receptor-like isoform X2 n=1 Tax=Archocentrus centrarchus TaxID=63155 RepID=UPI0011EA31C8|nr:polymeric immunoglobulin receptor-like isoform X2 [Archocentrus centrarchus]